MRTLFVAWQDPDSRSWFPVGRLWQENGAYRFVYIGGLKSAVQHGFRLLASFPRTDIIYTSQELFPLFRNRVMSKSRQDFGEFISRLNLSGDLIEPFDILSREARRATDQLEMFPMPEILDGRARLEFLVRGLEYLPTEAQQRVTRLSEGEKLYALLDAQNAYDSNAVALRTEDRFMVGYVPRFLAAELKTVLLEIPRALCVSVSRVNLAPTALQYRLLCSLSVLSEQFSPYSSGDFQPLVQYPPFSSVAS